MFEKKRLHENDGITNSSQKSNVSLKSSNVSLKKPVVAEGGAQEQKKAER